MDLENQRNLEIKEYESTLKPLPLDEKKRIDKLRKSYENSMMNGTPPNKYSIKEGFAIFIGGFITGITFTCILFITKF